MNPAIEVSSDTITTTNEPEKEFPFKPLSNFIVLELHEPQERVTGSGVIIPEHVMIKTVNATVKAVSQEKDLEGHSFVRTVKVGDSVIFNMSGGMPVDIDGEDFLVIRETELFGVLTGEGGALMQMSKTAKPTPKLYRPN